MNKKICFNCGGKIKPYYPSICEKCNEKMLKVQDNEAMLEMMKRWGLEWFISREKWAKKTFKKLVKEKSANQ